MADIEIKDLPIASPISTTSLPVQTAAGVTGRVTLGSTAIRDLGAVYGHMYYSNSTGTNLALTVQNTWYGVTFVAAGNLKGLTADAADATADHLTVPAGYAGDYRIQFSCCADPDAAGTYEIGLHINGSPCARGGIAIVSPSVSDSISVTGHSMPSLSDGDEISFRARCTSAASKTLKFFVVSFTAERVGA